MAALYIIPILAVLILVHEIGHFVSARLVGIRVKEFGLGLPPRLFGVNRGGVLYSFNAIPLGGFVRVHGEDGSAADPDSLHAKSKLQRAFFFGAGSLMNFALAIVLVTVLVGARGEPVPHVYVAGVEPGTPAEQAGWEAGDRFVSVAGVDVEAVSDVVTTTHAHAGEAMPVMLLRNGQMVETTIVPREDPPPGQGPTGIRITASPAASLTVHEVEPGTAAAAAGIQEGDRLVSIAGREIVDASVLMIAFFEFSESEVPLIVQRDGQHVELSVPIPASPAPDETPEVGLAIQQSIQYDRIPFWQVIPRGIAETWNIVAGLYDAIMLLISGQESLGGIAGPIGMGQLTSEVLAISPEPAWVALANLTILLSLNLGILNLLPLPALDGGRLFFVLIETIRGRPIPPEKEGLVHFVGLVMLLAVMVIIAFMDIDRLLSGDSLLQ